MLGKPLHLTFALLVALAAPAVPAQTGKPAARPASAPAATVRTPPAGTVDPDPQATPQFSIPLRETPGGQAPSVGAKRAAGKPTGGSIDDATARCQAQPSEAERAECLDAARKGAKR